MLSCHTAEGIRRVAQNKDKPHAPANHDKDSQQQWDRAPQDRRAPSAAQPARGRLLAERAGVGHGRDSDVEDVRIRES